MFGYLGRAVPFEILADIPDAAGLLVGEEKNSRITGLVYASPSEGGLGWLLEHNG
jgi:hypothetical protein